MTYPGYTNGPTYYPQGDYSGYVVYLDFGGLAVDGGLPDVGVVLRLFQVVAGCLAPAGVTVTNRLPTGLRPGEYTTVRMLPALGIAGRSGDASGNCPVKQLLNPSWYVPCNVYVEIADVELWGATAAHEAVHAMTGLDTVHESIPVDGSPNLMAGGTANIRGGKLSPTFVKDIRATIARIKAGDRFGFHYVPGTTSGAIVNDWFNIGA